MGILPVANSDAMHYDECDCDFCQGWRATISLQSNGSECLRLASHDNNLQEVIAAWRTLPDAILGAMVVMIEANPPLISYRALASCEFEARRSVKLFPVARASRTMSMAKLDIRDVRWQTVVLRWTKPITNKNPSEPIE